MIDDKLKENPAASPQRARPQRSTAQSTRVLLVEDEPLTAEIFARALTRAGLVVDVARDGLQALRRLRERVPSAVVLDMSLPTMSGAKVVRELRADGVEVPIVVVSGRDQEDSSLTDEELHPGLWINKPLKPRRLVKILQDLLDSPA